MRITTKRGDAGKTFLSGGKSVSKCGLRIEAIGALDEAISFLGLAKAELKEARVKRAIRSIQTGLLRAAAEIARRQTGLPEGGQAPAKFESPIKESDVKELEAIAEAFGRKAKIPRCCVIPGVNEISACLHIARTVVRRAERSVVALSGKAALNPLLLVYLNRLSDLLFVMAVCEEGKPRSSRTPACC